MATIRIPSLWRSDALGLSQVEIRATTLADALNQLTTRYPKLRDKLYAEQQEVNAALNLFINEEHIRFRGGLSASLRDGDTVYIVPLVSGGSQ